MVFLSVVDLAIYMVCLYVYVCMFMFVFMFVFVFYRNVGKTCLMKTFIDNCFPHDYVPTV